MEGKTDGGMTFHEVYPILGNLLLILLTIKVNAAFNLVSSLLLPHLSVFISVHALHYCVITVNHSHRDMEDFAEGLSFKACHLQT